jgi:hypothetical protein
MKHIKKFNENFSTKEGEITITMNDVRETKHNLGDGDSFLKEYSWSEDQILIARPGYNKSGIWDGKEVKIFDLVSYEESYMAEIGYAILIDGRLEYIIGIYEPHGCSINSKRGCITAHGHEQIIKLWLDDGEFEEIHTR